MISRVLLCSWWSSRAAPDPSIINKCLWSLCCCCVCTDRQRIRIALFRRREGNASRYETTTTQPHRVFSVIVTRPGRSTRVILRTQSGLLQLFVCWLFTICSSFSDFSNADVLRVQNDVKLTWTLKNVLTKRQTEPASQNQQRRVCRASA